MWQVKKFKLKKLIAKWKKDFYQNKLQTQAAKKNEFFQLFNNLTGTAKNKRFNIENTISDADSFNNYFADNGKKLANAFHNPHNRQNSKKDIEKSILLRPVKSYENKQILESLKLKFSLGCHNINHAFILSIREQLEPVLKKCFDNDIFRTKKMQKRYLH